MKTCIIRRTISISALFLGACDGDCSEPTKRAEVFIEDNRACEVDADCVVVDVGCAKLEGAFCGQVTISREAAESESWREVQGELLDCEAEHGDACAICSALLVPRCTDSVCGR